MMESELVFAYGSNMDPVQMRERCPESDLSWFVAKLSRHRLCFPRKSTNRKGGVGSVEKDPSGEVWGVVFAVSKKDLLRLDSFEGVNSGSYTREPISVVDSNGDEFPVCTYVAIPEEPRKEFSPHEDYIKLYLRGAEYFGLPDSYIASLKKIKTLKKRRPRPKGPK